MTTTISFTRRPSRATKPGASLAGAAQVDITPHLQLPMAGYSTMGKDGDGWRGRLYARCLYLQGDAEKRVAFCVIDQMSASRYLLEAVASRTVETCGLSVDRLVLAGTHTHKAPGNFYGNTFYDSFAQDSGGFDRSYADWLAERIALCVQDAVEVARPARLGFGCAKLWAFNWNRSFAGFLANPGGLDWWLQTGMPGEGADQRVPAARQSPYAAVDPRVRALAAFGNDDDKLIGALATFGCHATTVPYKTELLSADWPGDAQLALRKSLSGDDAGGVVALGISGGGDVTACDLSHREDVGYFQRSEEMGVAVSGAVVQAIQSARQDLREITVDSSFYEAHVAEPEFKEIAGNAQTRLAEHWAVGVPTLAGSEESPSLLKEAEYATEGVSSQTDFANDPPQIPKAAGVHNAIVRVLECLTDFHPSRVWPMHSVQVSGYRFATVPGEPTTVAAWQIEEAAKLDRDTNATVLGWAGDYSGYFTTVHEYGQQQYEGSSMLWGCNSTNYLRKAHQLIAEGTLRTQISPQGEEIAFEVPRVVRRFRPRDVQVAPTYLRPWVDRSRGKTVVRWFMPEQIRIIPDDYWFARVEFLHDDGSWLPVRLDGQDFDDVRQHILIRRSWQDEESGLGRWVWSASFAQPISASQLRLNIAARGGFPGFQIAL